MSIKFAEGRAVSHGWPEPWDCKPKENHVPPHQLRAQQWRARTRSRQVRNTGFPSQFSLSDFHLHSARMAVDDFPSDLLQPAAESGILHNQDARLVRILGHK